MKIGELLWPQDRTDHIARHGITIDEVEEVCFGRPLVQRAKSRGENPVYYVLGQTDAGRYLFCVAIQFPDGRGLPITARAMTGRERRRYRQWRNR
ncbi:MAG: BrnT family toxin [Caldilineaceae bacterium SB0670_bin_27]|uniref:BrnT family toxin n=1 Tax=Caldilineaceae bacterium SB0664_bin_27 TaxID=2605260 RepID=A0A6B0YQP6_9CHLR|nr:BrnT family toxin [Caldilineaceae bacterium SB0664_bin_27]MYJ77195.1 BrnT family toxin [Caldilineaceae bacterium SB0670_bin_27]